MTNEFILIFLTLIIGFTAGFVSFYIYAQKVQTISSAALKKELAFAPIYLSSWLIFALLYWITPLENDFIHDFKISLFLVPLTLTGMSYVLSLIKPNAFYINIAIIISAAISVFFLPAEFLMFKGYLPFWADRLVIIALWSTFSCFYYILKSVDGLLPIYNLSFLSTFFILSLLDAAPLFLGLLALGFLSVNTSFLIFNWFPAKISLTENSEKIFGFMLGGLMIFGCSENLAPCFAITLSVFALELIQSLIKKLSLRERYTNLSNNTICYQAHISGLTPDQVCASIAKVQILFIILSCFQVYLPNDYSLPIISIFLAAWFLDKLKNWNTPKQNLKEINQEFVKDLRQNIYNIKNKINRD